MTARKKYDKALKLLAVELFPLAREFFACLRMDVPIA